MENRAESDDPFRPPQSGPEPQPELRREPGAPLEWDPLEVYTFAWNALRAHPLTVVAFLLAMIVQFSVSLAMEIVALALEIDIQTPFTSNWYTFQGVNYVLALPLAAYVNLGMARFALELCRGRRPGVERMFATEGYLTSLLASLLAQVAVPVLFAVLAGLTVGPGAALYFATDGDPLSWLVIGVGVLVWLAGVVYGSVRILWWMSAIAYGERDALRAFRVAIERSSGQFWPMLAVLLAMIPLMLIALFLGLCPGLFVGMLATVPAAVALYTTAAMGGFLARSGERPVLATRE
ncbi:MAG: hypothetical protein JNN27_03070 [Planctomycetes bacterium]|nr:hypothetical protein [Planctomycetota bacterium]